MGGDSHCANHSTRYNKNHIQILYAEKKEVLDEEEEDTQGSHAISDGSQSGDVSKDCDTSTSKGH